MLLLRTKQMKTSQRTTAHETKKLRDEAERFYFAGEMERRSRKRRVMSSCLAATAEADNRGYTTQREKITLFFLSGCRDKNIF